MQLIKHDKRISLERATEGSAGIDVQAAIDSAQYVYPGEIKMIPLGFSMHIGDANIAALLLPRSGLGKKGIVLANTVGLIDSDYQGQVMAAVKNTGNEAFLIAPLDRIGQMIFAPVIHPEFEIVDSFTDATVRGEGGFGSTGVDAKQTTEHHPV